MRAQRQPETFRTIAGHGLLEAIPAIVPWPYAAVTMADLWPALEPALDASAVRVIEVKSLEGRWLDQVADGLDGIRSLVGLGGGQALDAAKYLAVDAHVT